MTTELTAVLADLEKAREKLQGDLLGLRRELWIWIGISLAIFGTCLSVYLSGHPDFAIVLMVFGGFVLFLGLIIIGTVGGEREAAVADRVKLSVLPILAGEIDPGLNYLGSQEIPQAEFDATGLYEPADFYISGDLFQGRVGQTDIRFAVAMAEKHHETTVTERDAQGRIHTRVEIRTEKLFEGIFFSADFNKHFDGRTRLWSGEAGFIDEMAEEHVELESPDFDARFKVRSTNQVEARYLLTLAMMERLLEAQARLGQINVAFAGGRIAILIPWRFNLFAPDLDQPMDTAMLDRYRGLLRSVTDIVGELDLNTRIWTKT